MSRRKGFTLVELLVVIGIIAVLIGILIPVLSKARESAQRTACLSNIRELNNMMRVYGATFHDEVPIGFMDEKAFSYIMNWCNGNGVGPSQMGLLVVAGIVKNPKTFYCPSTSADDTKFSYQPNPNSATPSDNPWPFWTTKHTPAVHTRLGFNARPAVQWPPAPADPSHPITTTGATAFPHLRQMTNLALLADLLFYKGQVLKTHKKGINVLYGNGSARWVDLKAFDKTTKYPGANYLWSELIDSETAANGAFNWNNNNLFLNDGTWTGGGTKGSLNAYSQQSGLWIDLDKQ